MKLDLCIMAEIGPDYIVVVVVLIGLWFSFSCYCAIAANTHRVTEKEKESSRRRILEQQQQPVVEASGANRNAIRENRRKVCARVSPSVTPQ